MDTEVSTNYPASAGVHIGLLLQNVRLNQVNWLGVLIREC